MLECRNGVKTLFLLACLFIADASVFLFEGDNCVFTNRSRTGKCVNIRKCEYAHRLLKNSKILPQVCGFDTFDPQIPLVCCPTFLIRLNEARSKKKCEEYHNPRNLRTTIAKGVKARFREFPHMAALGYGVNQSNPNWLCGGSLISELFVLTAAHCTKSVEFGNPKLVRLGDLNLNDTKDDLDYRDIPILTIFVHPGYKPPSHYNDIALIKLQKSVRFNLSIRPACIYTQASVPDAIQLQAIGWGKTDFLGDTSDHLMKVFLNGIEYKECAKLYSSVASRKLAIGLDDRSQICAGDSSGKDTCPGDSGGPLHFIKRGNLTLLDHFVIVGITSFGKACGLENSAGVYTRVSFYQSWIEDIVWSKK